MGKDVLKNLKLEAANEIGIDHYEEIDKGQLSSRANGSVGGQMVKQMIQEMESKLQ